MSYAHDDRELASAIVEVLAADGLSVWWDPDIATGDDFDRAIESALGSAGCVVVVWTPPAVASRWVRAEARAALERGTLLSVLVGEGLRLPIEFSGIQGIELRTVVGQLWPADRHRLVRAARAVLADGSVPDPRPTTRRRRWLPVAVGAVALLALAGVVAVATRTRSPLRTTVLTLGEKPYDVVVTRRAEWVTDWGRGLLWRRDRTNGSSASIVVPGALELAADDSRAPSAATIAVSSSAERSTVRIVADDATVTRAIDTGSTVDDMALTIDLLVVAHHDAGRVDGLDLATGRQRWTTTVPGATSLVADGEGVWVTAGLGASGEVLHLDGATGAVRARTTVGPSPVGITTLRDQVWIADQTLGTVNVYDRALHRLGVVPAGAGLVDLATDGHVVWASSSASSELVVIDPGRRTVVQRVRLPGQPFKIDGRDGQIAATVPNGGQVVLATR